MLKCRDCKKTISLNEVAYVERKYSVIGDYSSGLRTYCETCGPDILLRKNCYEWINRELIRPQPCQECGRPFVKKRNIPGHASRIGRNFCGNTCESKFYRRQHRAREWIPHVPTCPQCRERFQAKRKDAKYCSTSCRVAAHRERLRRSA